MKAKNDEQAVEPSWLQSVSGLATATRRLSAASTSFSTKARALPGTGNLLTGTEAHDVSQKPPWRLPAVLLMGRHSGSAAWRTPNPAGLQAIKGQAERRRW